MAAGAASARRPRRAPDRARQASGAWYRVRVVGVRVAAATVALGALAAGASASPLPYLRSVGSSNGHVVAVVAAGDLLPLRVAVASSPRTEPSGAFVPASVRFQEVVTGARPGPQGVRLRTRHTLPPGRYWVEVGARATDVDCLPLKPCLERWSNVRLLVVPRRAG